MTYGYIVAPRNLFAWRIARWHRHHFLPSMMIRKNVSYPGSTSSPAALPDASVLKSRHMNASAHWEQIPAGIPCTRYNYNLPWGNVSSAPR